MLKDKTGTIELKIDGIDIGCFKTTCSTGGINGHNFFIHH